MRKNVSEMSGKLCKIELEFKNLKQHEQIKWIAPLLNGDPSILPILNVFFFSYIDIHTEYMY